MRLLQESRMSEAAGSTDAAGGELIADVGSTVAVPVAGSVFTVRANL